MRVAGASRWNSSSALRVIEDVGDVGGVDFEMLVEVDGIDAVVEVGSLGPADGGVGMSLRRRSGLKVFARGSRVRWLMPSGMVSGWERETAVTLPAAG